MSAKLKSYPDGPEVHEARPLLVADRQGIVEYSTFPGDPENQVSKTDSEPEETKDGSALWNRVVYAFWGLVGSAFMALLVKGFIESEDMKGDLKKALMAGLGAGLSGAVAMIPQILALMPFRTVMNYQYRHGTTATQAFHDLFHDGGLTRYYAGLTVALLQGPLSRFGDTAANEGILALLQANKYMRYIPTAFQTAVASLAAASFRSALAPIDLFKTTMQTRGLKGIAILRSKIRGIGALWYGAFATAVVTFTGHYPWFGVNNYLESSLPEAQTTGQLVLRRAAIGLAASLASDSISNSLRVVKNYQQTHESHITLTQAAQLVVAESGVLGLFGRGLKTRLLVNSVQGMTFSIFWKFLADRWKERMN